MKASKGQLSSVLLLMTSRLVLALLSLFILSCAPNKKDRTSEETDHMADPNPQPSAYQQAQAEPEDPAKMGSEEPLQIPDLPDEKLKRQLQRFTMVEALIVGEKKTMMLRSPRIEALEIEELYRWRFELGSHRLEFLLQTPRTQFHFRILEPSREFFCVSHTPKNWVLLIHCKVKKEPKSLELLGEFVLGQNLRLELKPVLAQSTRPSYFSEKKALEAESLRKLHEQEELAPVAP